MENKEILDLEVLNDIKGLINEARLVDDYSHIINKISLLVIKSAEVLSDSLLFHFVKSYLSLLPVKDLDEFERSVTSLYLTYNEYLLFSESIDKTR